MGSLEVDRAAMAAAAGDGHATATSLADELVRRGLAFRVAHGVVGRLVAAAEAAAIGLDAVPDGDIRSALASVNDDTAAALAGDPGLAEALRGAASIQVVLAGADVIGGTAPVRVGEAVAAARQRLARA
jgi:argininosuccinate lyase